jgi:hypothetical protein
MPKRKRRPVKPRNPYVALARRLGHRVALSPKAYRRRPKHRRAVDEPERD